MNLGGMGAAGMDNMAQQIQASSNGEHAGDHNSGSSSNAALITSMANI
jgi:erythrocyte band 7 integral membrane protein